MEQQNKTRKNFLKDENNLYESFLYELGNHEYIITHDYDDTLNALGLKYEKLTEKQIEVLEKAKKDYLKYFEEETEE